MSSSAPPGPKSAVSVAAVVDADRPAFREELRAALALVAPDGDVEVVGLVAPLAGRLVLLARVHRDPQLANCGSARRVPQLGILRQVADEHDSVDVRHLFLLRESLRREPTPLRGR